MRMILSAAGVAVFGALQSFPALVQEIDFPETRNVEEYGWGRFAPIEPIKPRYPRAAAMQGKDGWVHMGMTIQEDGTVADAFVIDSYPPGDFNESALEALAKWTYPVPGEGDDYTLPEKRQVVFTYQLNSGNGVRSLFGNRLRTARNAIASGDIEKADERIAVLTKQAETDWLNLYELAALEQTKALRDFQQGDYAAAVVHAERTLRFGSTLDEDNIAATHRLLFMSYFTLNEFADAVRAYDDWRAVDEGVVETEFAPTVEQIRQALAEGRPIVAE